MSLGIGTASHQQANLSDFPANPSVHNAGDAMQVDDDVEQFDDTLDEIISNVPDPFPPSQAGQMPRTSSAIGDRTENERSFSFGPTSGQPVERQTQAEFDAQVYRDLVNESIFRTSRQITGLYDMPVRTVTHRSFLYDSDAPADDSDDDEFSF